MSKKDVVVSDAPKGDKSLRGLVLRSLLPSKEVVTREVLSKPKGTVYKVARIFGYATEAVVKTKTADDGGVSTVISLEGVFRQEGGARFSSITLTQAFSKAIKDRLESMSIVMVDANVNLENTGVAGSPYKWLVTSDLSAEKSDAMAVFPASQGA
jgi:hypothetical protein